MAAILYGLYFNFSRTSKEVYEPNREPDPPRTKIERGNEFTCERHACQKL
jgi:hypothetical protein